MSTFHLAHHAEKQRWLPDDPLALEIIARLMEREEPVTIIQQAGKPLPELPASVQVLNTLPVEPEPTQPLVIITDRLLGMRPEVDRLVVLRPPTLTLGVACRRQVEYEDFAEAVRQFSRRTGYSQQSIQAIAASARRRSLGVLEELADKLQVPMLFYDDRILSRTPLPQPGKMAGTCAVAAILAAGVTAPLVPTTSLLGKFTLALARRQDSV
ncbi:MAG TPA: cobalamin biosynthesis protein [Gemmatales bacterium]|nr:cobalamin biosynthesis protein [Gemmatales bacterium]